MLDCHYYFNDAKRIDNRSQRRIINSNRPGCLNGLYGGNTYIVQDLSTQNTFQDTDIVVKLVGEHDLSGMTVADFNFA